MQCNEGLFSVQKLKNETRHEINGEKINGEKTNGEKTNGEKTNGEKTTEEKANGEKTNGLKQDDSPPPVKKETDSSLADIEEAIPDTTNDQKIMDRVLDKTRYVSMQACLRILLDWLDGGFAINGQTMKSSSFAQSVASSSVTRKTKCDQKIVWGGSA